MLCSCSLAASGMAQQNAWGSCVSPGEGLLPSAHPHPRSLLRNALCFALHIQHCSFFGEQNLLAFPSKGTWIPPMVEEGGRAWHGEIPRGLISVQAQADVLHLPGDQLTPAAVHRGSGGPLLLAVPWLSGTFPQLFCCIFPSLMLPAPGQPLAHKPSHPSPKTSCFTGAQQWAPRLAERGRHPLQGGDRTGLGQTPAGLWDVGSNSTSPGWDADLDASLICTAGTKLFCENVSILTVPSFCQASSFELDEAWVSDPSFSSWRVKRKKSAPSFCAGELGTRRSHW